MFKKEFNQSKWCMQHPKWPIRNRKIRNCVHQFNEKTLNGRNPVGVSKEREKERIRQKSKVSTVDIQIWVSIFLKCMVQVTLLKPNNSLNLFLIGHLPCTVKLVCSNPFIFSSIRFISSSKQNSFYLIF